MKGEIVRYQNLERDESLNVVIREQEVWVNYQRGFPDDEPISVSAAFPVTEYEQGIEQLLSHNKTSIESKGYLMELSKKQSGLEMNLRGNNTIYGVQMSLRPEQFRYRRKNEKSGIRKNI